METTADLVAAEDVLLFVNAAITATGQAEFHADAGEQRLSLDFLHDYMLTNYRRLYAGVLALGVNHHNTAMIIHRLLATGAETAPEDRRVEGGLIAARLAALPPQRVYRLFRDLRRAKVNNRRTRRIVTDWIAARPDPALDAVKYRTGLKSALRHIHLDAGELRHTHLDARAGELGDFLFATARTGRYASPLLDAWHRAHYEQAAVYDLPYTVAEGFAARHKVPRKVFLERIAPRMTSAESARLRETAVRHGAPAVGGDLGRMPLTRLAGYVLSLPLDERASRRAELTGALRAAAVRTAGAHAGTWGGVTAVLDDSFSSYGSGHKRRRPLAVALACHHLLDVLAERYTPLWTSGRTDALLLYPYGATPVGRRVLDALDTGPERLVIVSDGFDNAPVGLAGEVLRVFRGRLDPDHRTRIVHLNPVYDAGDFDVRRLAPGVPTAGIRDAEDLPALVEIARFAEGRTGLSELTAYLDERAVRLLGEPTPGGAR